MSNAAAIETLEKRLADQVRKANNTVEVLNDLRAEDGLPPIPPLSGGPGGGGSAGIGDGTGTGPIRSFQIKPDTFYGQKLQTAIRSYLKMRRDAGNGPATPREIYTAITAGGYQFEAKDEATALVGLRALIRKRTQFFHKLPNGNYGLTEWYPNAKQPKHAATTTVFDRVEDDDETETAPNPGKGKDAA